MSKPVSELQALLALTIFPDLGPNDIGTLLMRYKTASEVILNFKQWRDQDCANNIDSALKWADNEIVLAERQQIHLLGIFDQRYPEILRQTACPPPILYVKGKLSDWNCPSVAIVGSRNCTYYGSKVAKEISRDLAAAGLTIVSGLARGIDSAAHTAALEASGITLSILGHGLMCLYPKENKALADKICLSGALISEFPMQMRPYPGNFPRRNRIIAGLSLGVLVIEGRQNSGSLITARMAAQEGREVMAVPGPITSEMSIASHQLIQCGAQLVHNAADVLSALSITKKSLLMTSLTQRNVTKSNGKLPPHLEEIVKNVTDIPIQKEILAHRLKLELSSLASSLVELELLGHIKQLEGGLLVKA